MNNVTAQTIELMGKALGSPMAGDQYGNLLNKVAVTTASGLVWYDLQAPARLLVPFITPLRNKLSRKHRTGGTSTRWKVISAIADAAYLRMGWTPEGARSGQLTYTATDKLASYQTIGAEAALTFEEESAAEGLEDANSRASFILLEQMMLKEEMALLAGNSSVLLGTPTTPTVAAAGTGATLPAATYSVIVVALTVEGYAQSSAPAGVATQKVITAADGKSYTINGGSSNKSAAASQAVTLGQTLSCSTPVINGAVAYAWYVGTAGNEKLEKITTINSATFSAPLLGTGQAATVITGDKSANNGSLGGGTVTAFDGLMTTTYAQGALSNAIVTALATGTAGTGTVLTASGKGTVNEIDTILLQLWNTYRVSPNAIWVNAQEMNNITTKCLNAASGPLLRVNTNPQDVAQLTAGAFIDFYFNPYAVGGGTKIPVLIHPDIPAGTIFFQGTELPGYYKNADTPTVAEVITRRDYYRIDWPLVTRERQYGVYAEETLAVYAPFCLAILTNIGNG